MKSIKIIDTHCHPQDKKYDSDLEAVLERAREAGLAVICVGTDLEMSRSAVEMSEKYDFVWASVGLHPNDNLSEEYDESEYAKLAEHSRVVAIGEVGLDYYRTTDEVKKKFQKERFLKQIALAKRSKKPLIIHCREAHQDMIEVLSGELVKLEANEARLCGVIHSFTGTYENAKKYIELGFMVGFNGIVTFAHDYDETVKNIPLESILLETDSPYLAPEPYRGQRNEPAYVIEVAKKIAELRGIPEEEVISQTTQNAVRLFGLN